VLILYSERAAVQERIVIPSCRQHRRWLVDQCRTPHKCTESTHS